MMPHESFCPQIRPFLRLASHGGSQARVMLSSVGLHDRGGHAPFVLVAGLAYGRMSTAARSLAVHLNIARTTNNMSYTINTHSEALA
jgi:hypothetical protein